MMKFTCFEVATGIDIKKDCTLFTSLPSRLVITIIGTSFGPDGSSKSKKKKNKFLGVNVER